MKLLKKANYILAILGFAYAILYFTDTIDLPTNAVTFFLGVMFLLQGIERIKGHKKKEGYLTLMISMLLLFATLIDIIRII